MTPITAEVMDGRVLTVMREDRPEWGAHVLAYNKKTKRWEGIGFAPMAKRRICWEESLPQPTHYVD